MVVAVRFENKVNVVGVGNKKVFCLRARKFRLKDARTSFIHLELIRYKIDIRWIGSKWLSSLIVINSSYGSMSSMVHAWSKLERC